MNTVKFSFVSLPPLQNARYTAHRLLPWPATVGRWVHRGGEVVHGLGAIGRWQRAAQPSRTTHVGPTKNPL